MNAFQLLFNPNGRITRLSYALLNGVFGALNFGLVALIVWRGGGDFWTAVSLGPMAMIERSPALGFVICVALFVQACLAIKRSRDMMGSPVAGLLYVFA